MSSFDYGSSSGGGGRRSSYGRGGGGWRGRGGGYGHDYSSPSSYRGRGGYQNRGHHHHHHHQYRHHSSNSSGGEQLSGEKIAFGRRMEQLNRITQQNDFGRKEQDSVKRYYSNHYTSIIRHIQDRVVADSDGDAPFIQPHVSSIPLLRPPRETVRNPACAITAKNVVKFRPRGNAQNSPALDIAWNPDGRRLVSVHRCGSLLQWRPITFRFGGILTPSPAPHQCIAWNRGKDWMLTGDGEGNIHYWQVTVKLVITHKGEDKPEPITGLDFSPMDTKFCIGADDGTVRVRDFRTSQLEREFTHPADVKAIAWHPSMSIIAAGIADTVGPLKLWDARAKEELATLYDIHKGNVTAVKWHKHGNVLASASKDSQVKLFDIRMMRELQAFSGHKKDVTCLQWHPLYHDMCVSGGADGNLIFWQIGLDASLGEVENAHDAPLNAISWHPEGHVLSTTASDCVIKCWTRNMPGRDIALDTVCEKAWSEDQWAKYDAFIDSIRTHDSGVKPQQQEQEQQEKEAGKSGLQVQGDAHKSGSTAADNSDLFATSNGEARSGLKSTQPHAATEGAADDLFGESEGKGEGEGEGEANPLKRHKSHTTTTTTTTATTTTSNTTVASTPSSGLTLPGL